MKPDVIVCWPRSCDYPLWRQFIRDNRERFAKVIVVFTEHDGLDYREFVRSAMDDVTFLDSPHEPNKDWRDVAVNAALDVSDAEWVWFTEQDFFITQPDEFWEDVEESERHAVAIGWREPISHRWHPSSLFAKRSAIDETDRYFGPEPVDHFYNFGRQMEAVGPFLPITWRKPYEHLQGISQNHWLIDTGQTEGIFNEPRFRRYIDRKSVV